MGVKKFQQGVIICPANFQLHLYLIRQIPYRMFQLIRRFFGSIELIGFDKKIDSI